MLDTHSKQVSVYSQQFIQEAADKLRKWKDIRAISRDDHLLWLPHEKCLHEVNCTFGDSFKVFCETDVELGNVQESVLLVITQEGRRTGEHYIRQHTNAPGRGEINHEVTLQCRGLLITHRTHASVPL